MRTGAGRKQLTLLMHFLAKIDDVLERIEKAVVVALFASLVLLITFNILARNLFDVSFQKILEFTPALVLWISLLGATLALKKGRHIKLEILLRYTGIKSRLISRIISGLFGMFVMAILFFVSISFVKNEWVIFGIHGATSIVFPLFFALSSFRYMIGSFTVAEEPLHDRNKTNQNGDPQGKAHSAKEDS